jgi:hypothetical protein
VAKLWNFLTLAPFAQAHEDPERGGSQGDKGRRKPVNPVYIDPAKVILAARMAIFCF